MNPVPPASPAASPSGGSPSSCICAGRLSLETPPGFERSHLAAKIRHVVVEKMEPRAESALSSPEAVWKARLEEIQTIDRPYDPRGGKILESRALVPGRLMAVLYRPRGNAERWQGMLVTSAALVWLYIETAHAQQAEALRRLYDVATAWRSLTQEQPFPLVGTDAFYLVDAAVCLPVQYMESINVVWRKATGKQRLELHSKFPPDRDAPGLLERASETLAMMGMRLAGGVDQVRAGKKRVGGIEGEEFVVTYEENDRRYFRATWLCLGAREPIPSPAVRFQLEGAGAEEKPLLALWDGVLSSVKWIKA